MKRFTNLLPFIVGCVFLTFCSPAVGSLLACVASFHELIGPLSFRAVFDFLHLWLLATLFLGWFVLSNLWWVVLFFGAWAAVFPPQRRLAWGAFLLVAALAGLFASRAFQQVRPWDFGYDGSPRSDEAVESVATSPPPVQMASLTTSLSCITALSSATFCALALRRWFHRPPSNTALQRTLASSRR